MRPPIACLVMLAACSKTEPRAERASPLSATAPPAPASVAKEEPPPDLPPLGRGAVLTARLAADCHPSQPVFVGETNLPDGTDIGFDVEDWRPGKRPLDSRIIMQGHAVVTHGRYMSVKFAENVPLAPGAYEAQGDTLNGPAQLEAVRRAIGEHGENLRGKLVRNEDGEARVSVRLKFRVP